MIILLFYINFVREKENNVINYPKNDDNYLNKYKILTKYLLLFTLIKLLVNIVKKQFSSSNALLITNP